MNLNTKRIRKAIRRRFDLIRNPLLDPFDWRHSKAEFMQLAPVSSNVESVIKFLKHYQGSGFYRDLFPLQHESELQKLIQRVQSIKPQIIMEIGTNRGGTLVAWGLSNPTLELLVSLDLPHGKFGGGYAPQRAKLYKLIETVHPCCRVELIRGDSHAASSLEQIKQLLAGRAIDFLFIDGDHTYTGALQDYQMYKSLVRSGGLIAFHDIVVHPNWKDVEVHRVWAEVKREHQQAEELLDTHHQTRFGIGVVTVL